MKRSTDPTLVKDYARPVNTLIEVQLTVDEAIKKIRENHHIDLNILYFYAIDEHQNLLGVISTRDLLVSPPQTRISDIMHTKMQTLQASQTMHEGLVLMQQSNLLAIPVVENGRFVGVLDIHDFLEEKIKLDSTKKRIEVFQSLGFMIEEGTKPTTFKKYRIRIPWMFCNMFGGVACAIISDLYKVVLIKFIVLAMFIPLVLSLSESISMQSMTQSLHEIHRNKFFLKHSFRYILHESKLFVLVALTCGTVIGLLSLLWGDGHFAALTIGASIGLGILVSAIIGGTVPLLLHITKLDPKIASGPIVLMLADVLTTMIYFTIAYFVLL